MSDLKREDFKPLLELFELANSRKLLVDNLTQIDLDFWRANVRTIERTAKGGPTYEYGNGEWPEQALTNALYNADVRIKHGQGPQLYSKLRRHRRPSNDPN